MGSYLATIGIFSQHSVTRMLGALGKSGRRGGAAGFAEGKGSAPAAPGRECWAGQSTRKVLGGAGKEVDRAGLP